MTQLSDDEYRKLAKEHWASDDLEFDNTAAVSVGEDGEGPVGAWVAAWVWVENPDSERDKPIDDKFNRFYP